MCIRDRKHADASKVWVNIAGDQQGLTINIRDNGKGLDGNAVESIGMLSMHSRARCIGATCAVKSHQEGGVRVQLSLSLLSTEDLRQVNVA